MSDISETSSGSRKALGIIVAIVIVVLAGAGFCLMMRFSLIHKDEAVKAAWANVETVYQRRADLIPNLVETVKGAAKFESSTHKDIVEAQNKLLAIHRDFKSSMQTQGVAQVEEQYVKLVEASKRFMDLSVTAFPNLKGVEAFTTLQAQLEGTENRIAVARREYNLAVQDYNATVRKWSWLPLCGGFRSTAALFEAAPGAEKPPAVKFE